MRIYQYISHFRDLKQINVHAQNIRDTLGISDKYKAIDDLKKWVVNPAMKELGGKADVWFDIAENIKEGRRVVGWKFNIYSKDGASKKTKKERLVRGTEEKEEKERMFKRLVEFYELGDAQAKKAIEKIPLKDLHKVLMPIQYMKLGGRIHSSTGAYTIAKIKSMRGIQL